MVPKYYWMQCAENATSYPGPISGTGGRTATAGSSVTLNSTKVIIHTITMTDVATGNISIQNHAGTVTYIALPVSGTPSPVGSMVLDLEIPSGFRVVSDAVGVTCLVTYLPLN